LGMNGRAPRRWLGRRGRRDGQGMEDVGREDVGMENENLHVQGHAPGVGLGRGVGKGRGVGMRQGGREGGRVAQPTRNPNCQRKKESVGPAPRPLMQIVHA